MHKNSYVLTHIHVHTSHTHMHQLDLPDIDPTGPGCQKLLLKCAQTGTMVTLKKLVEAGCDPRLVRSEGSQTSLHEACQGGHLHLVQYLVSTAHCDPNERDSRGRSCLDLALRADPRPVQVLDYLVRALCVCVCVCVCVWLLCDSLFEGLVVSITVRPSRNRYIWG